MDPLSIAGVIVAISTSTIKTARAIHLLIDKYKHAEQTISAIHSESHAISAFLGQIQDLLLRNPDVLQKTFKSQAALEATFDAALSGCMEVYSILDMEIQKLYNNGNAVKAKIQALWKEDIMKDLLDQVRWRKAALGFLVQGLQFALQLDSDARLEKFFRDNTAKLVQLAQSISDLRLAHPNSKRPPSVFEAASDDVASLYSDNSNTFGAGFAFDNLIVTAEPYRKAQAYNVQKLSSVKERAKEETGQQAQPSESGEKDEKESERMDSEGTDERHGLHRLLPENLQLRATTASQRKALAKAKSELEARVKDLAEVRDSMAELKKDRDRLEEELMKQTENAETQLDAAQAERAELEKTEALLREQLKSVEASNDSYRKHLSEMASTRITLKAAHERALSVKSAELEKVEKALEEHRSKLQLTNTMLKDSEMQLAQFAHELVTREKYHKETLVSLDKLSDENKVLKQDCLQKDTELAQWRQYEAIFAQLRTLPKPDSSTSITPVARSEHETNSSLIPTQNARRPLTKSDPNRADSMLIDTISSNTSPNETFFGFDPPPLLQSAAVREPTKTHAAPTTLGGLAQNQRQVELPTERPKNWRGKRRTVQVEYVPPRSSTARGDGTSTS